MFLLLVLFVSLLRSVGAFSVKAAKMSFAMKSAHVSLNTSAEPSVSPLSHSSTDECFVLSYLIRQLPALLLNLPPKNRQCCMCTVSSKIRW